MTRLATFFFFTIAILVFFGLVATYLFAVCFVSLSHQRTFAAHVDESENYFVALSSSRERPGRLTGIETLDGPKGVLSTPSISALKERIDARKTSNKEQSEKAFTTSSPGRGKNKWEAKDWDWYLICFCAGEVDDEGFYPVLSYAARGVTRKIFTHITISHLAL
ncbi:hypothetical protein BKA70DRAFT_1527746 [Coprinopsis sp. MPI-PUGE-AT-0042]|nr:hypothetical protein BKA70DRAFT_1527746 [Coprinopsis sp. MPI-PUGE-AT-0042]